MKAMNDLISRQDVINAILVSNFSACTVYGRSEEGMATAKELIQAINNLPSAQPQRWIPVSERLPEEYGNYLISLADGNVDIGTYAEFSRVDWSKWTCCDADGMRYINDEAIIAWMPLPDPYKEEE